MGSRRHFVWYGACGGEKDLVKYEIDPAKSRDPAKNFEESGTFPGNCRLSQTVYP